MRQANKAKTQELQALRDEHAKALAAERKRGDDVEGKLRDAVKKAVEAEKQSRSQTSELEKAGQQTDELRASLADVSVQRLAWACG